MKKYLILFTIVLLLALTYLFLRYFKTSNQAGLPQSTPTLTQTTPSPTASPSLVFPISQFKERITKKPFGAYITPQNSPVQPERFIGYHTGVDVEYEEVTTDVPVYAISDGTIVLAETASGYGGVLMIEIELDNTPHTVLYGHLRPSSLPKVGQKVKKGEQLAVLGTGNSPETDNERRHLHFAVLSDNRLDIKGYVQTKNELAGWLDPLAIF